MLYHSKFTTMQIAWRYQIIGLLPKNWVISSATSINCGDGTIGAKTLGLVRFLEVKSRMGIVIDCILASLASLFSTARRIEASKKNFDVSDQCFEPIPSLHPNTNPSISRALRRTSRKGIVIGRAARRTSQGVLVMLVREITHRDVLLTTAPS